MSDTPRLMVYEVVHGVADEGTGEDFGSVITTRDPTVPEVIAWLRAQGAINYEEAAEVIAQSLGQKLHDGHEAKGPCGGCRIDAKAIVDAALPTEDQS